jgi:hypothetical protein
MNKQISDHINHLSLKLELAAAGLNLVEYIQSKYCLTERNALIVTTSIINSMADLESNDFYIDIKEEILKSKK